MLVVSVLGPVEVRVGGQPVRVPAGKTAELLIRLAVEPGVSVRSDRLVEDLWGAEAAQTRRNTLQSKVLKLRRALGGHATIESADGGYRLAVDPSSVDAVSVVQAASAAHGLLDAGESRRAADLCAATLVRFSGEPLAGAGDGEWVAPHRARLDATRVQLIETWCSARLRLGEAGEVIADLQTVVADHPYQEGLWALLITALYQAGRQADALRAFQLVRTALADELGLEPGPQLRVLEQQILDHDASLPTGSGASSQIHPAPPGNLPPLAVDLVGRGADLGELIDLLGDRRLVEVIGPGGVGKTALVIAAGRLVIQPGGVWLVRLEAATTAGEVVDATVAALGVTGGEPALVERLKTAPTLLILDNCEHVLDDAAAWVTRLLEAARGVRILCTSQAPLDIAGSTLFGLAPLGVDDAVELFIRRANTQRTSRAAPDLGGSVHDLCRSLDGLPLAIELAAARTRTLSIDEISRRLDDRADDRLGVLSDPTSRRPERRRALRATIGWSYDLLFPDDQRGLWALATFAGSASLGAVEHVLAALGVPAQAAIDVVGRLASRSLVIVDDETAGRRYRLLDSIRAFALGAMTEAGMSEVAHAAHARWFADASASSTAGVRSSRQAEHLEAARLERSNIDAALSWCVHRDPPTALSIANGFGWAWVVLGDSRGAERLRTALAAVGDAAAPADRASALLLVGWIEASSGHLGPARGHVLEAIALAESIADVELQARCCYYLAYVVSHHGDFHDGLTLTDRSRALYAGLDRPWDQVANGLFAARAAISAGDEPRSVEAAADVQRRLPLVDDPWLHVRNEGMLGELARLQHRFGDAVVHLGRAAETSRRRGFLQTEAYQTASLGRAQCQNGDYDAGADTLRASIVKAEATGDVRMAALARIHLGRVLRALGQDAEARIVLEHTTAWHRAAGGGEQALLGECLLAALDAADGVDGATSRLAQVLELARTNDDAPAEVFALDALARTAAQAGDPTSARALLDQADRRMPAASHFVSERDRVDAHAVRER